MDLVDWDEKTYNTIVENFKQFASRLDNIVEVTFIPASALLGDNIVDKSKNMPWYQGPTLLYHLETVYIGADENHVDARFPVQWVIRPHSDKWHDFRGFAGRIAGGVFKPGDKVKVLPSGFESTIKGIHAMGDDLKEAFAPMSVAITLNDEIDISRGDMLVKQNNAPQPKQDIDAMICWFSSSKKLSGRGKYILRHTEKEVKALVTEVSYKVNINTLHKIEDDLVFSLNDIGRVKLRTSAPLIADSYRNNRITGSFVLIDEQNNETVAAGMII
jgi:sulfate adenylyltransferase subunit 1